MTSRSDLAPNSNGWRRLSYTCRAGFVDWGHALPDGALALKRQLDNEGPSGSFLDGLDLRFNGSAAFLVVYGQEMSKGPITVSTVRHYVVKKGLTQDQKNSVGLGIFMQASHGFERLQSSWPFSWISDSGYSSEDLVSNLIGFYSAFKGISQSTMRRQLGELGQAESEAIWDANVSDGLGATKNRTFRPILYPTPHCTGKTTFPNVLKTITAAAERTTWIRPAGRFLPGPWVNVKAPMDIGPTGRVSLRR